MKFEDILVKLKSIEQAILQRHPEVSKDHKFQVLARTAKVSEEYGELINEVLASLELQRAEKLAKYDKENMEKEFGDVFNALILLGLSLGFDVEEVVKSRVDEMYERYGNRTK